MSCCRDRDSRQLSRIVHVTGQAYSGGIQFIRSYPSPNVPYTENLIAGTAADPQHVATQHAHCAVVVLQHVVIHDNANGDVLLIYDADTANNWQIERVTAHPSGGYVVLELNSSSNDRQLVMLTDAGVTWTTSIGTDSFPGTQRHVQLDGGGNIYVMRTKSGGGNALTKVNSSGGIVATQTLSPTPTSGNWSLPRYPSGAGDAIAIRYRTPSSGVDAFQWFSGANTGPSWATSASGTVTAFHADATGVRYRRTDRYALIDTAGSHVFNETLASSGDSAYAWGADYVVSPVGTDLRRYEPTGAGLTQVWSTAVSVGDAIQVSSGLTMRISESGLIKMAQLDLATGAYVAGPSLSPWWTIGPGTAPIIFTAEEDGYVVLAATAPHTVTAFANP